VTLPIRVRRRAEFDIDEAFAWYELRGEGLGDALLRARLHRFPYGVYFTIREDFIDILSVYHGRRRPRRFDP